MAEQTLQNFISFVKTVGIPTASHYYIQISPNAADALDGNAVTEELLMMIDQVDIPGLTILTTEIRSFGEITESPYGISYPPVNLSVYLDNKMTAKTFFDKWSNQVFNRQKRTSGYYRDYIRDVSILLTDKNSNTILKVTLRECFPKTINDVPLDFNNHEAVKMNVTLAFKWWEIEQITPVDLQSIIASAEEGRTNQLLDYYSSIANQTNMYDERNNLMTENMLNISPINMLGQDMLAVGNRLTTSVGGSCARVSRSLTGVSLPGADSLKLQMNTFNSNFTDMGNTFGNIGKSLGEVLAPAKALAGSVSAVSNTLGGINQILTTVGIKNPFGRTISQLNGVAGTLSTISRAGQLPGQISGLGSAIGSMGTQFSEVSSAFRNLPGATNSMRNSFSQLGNSLGTQSNNITNVSNSLFGFFGGG